MTENQTDSVNLFDPRNIPSLEKAPERAPSDPFEANVASLMTQSGMSEASARAHSEHQLSEHQRYQQEERERAAALQRRKDDADMRLAKSFAKAGISVAPIKASSVK